MKPRRVLTKSLKKRIDFFSTMIVVLFLPTGTELLAAQKPGSFFAFKIPPNILEDRFQRIVEAAMILQTVLSMVRTRAPWSPVGELPSTFIRPLPGPFSIGVRTSDPDFLLCLFCPNRSRCTDWLRLRSPMPDALPLSGNFVQPRPSLPKRCSRSSNVACLLPNPLCNLSRNHCQGLEKCFFCKYLIHMCTYEDLLSLGLSRHPLNEIHNLGNSSSCHPQGNSGHRTSPNHYGMLSHSHLFCRLSPARQHLELRDVGFEVITTMNNFTC